MNRPDTPEHVGLHHEMDNRQLIMMLDYLYNTNYDEYIKCLEHVHSYMMFMRREEERWLAMNRPNAPIPSPVRMSTGGMRRYSEDSMFDSPSMLERIEDVLLEFETPSKVNGRTSMLTSDLKKTQI